MSGTRIDGGDNDKWNKLSISPQNSDQIDSDSKIKESKKVNQDLSNAVSNGQVRQPEEGDGWLAGKAREYGLERTADFLTDKDKVCTDGKDDGNISFGEKAEFLGKGLLGGIVKGIVKNPLESSAFIGGSTLAIGAGALVAGPVGAAAVGIGLTVVGIGFGIASIVKGIESNAASTSDGQTKAGYEEIGTGVALVTLSATGLKSARGKFNAAKDAKVKALTNPAETASVAEAPKSVETPVETAKSTVEASAQNGSYEVRTKNGYNKYIDDGGVVHETIYEDLGNGVSKRTSKVDSKIESTEETTSGPNGLRRIITKNANGDVTFEEIWENNKLKLQDFKGRADSKGYSKIENIYDADKLTKSINTDLNGKKMIIEFTENGRVETYEPGFIKHDPSSITYPNGAKVEYTVERGITTEVTETLDGKFISKYVHDALGRPVLQEYANPTVDGVIKIERKYGVDAKLQTPGIQRDVSGDAITLETYADGGHKKVYFKNHEYFKSEYFEKDTPVNF